MKRLLAAGYDKLYQIGPCFRHGEYGDRHNPEFCMLEWYRADADYRVILDDVQELIPAAVKAAGGDAAGFVYRGQQIKLTQPWNVQTVAKAFKEAAGWDPVSSFDSRRFEDDLVNQWNPPCRQTDRLCCWIIPLRRRRWRAAAPITRRLLNVGSFTLAVWKSSMHFLN